jgi:hypothetical protein
LQAIPLKKIQWNFSSFVQINSPTFYGLKISHQSKGLQTAFPDLLLTKNSSEPNEKTKNKFSIPWNSLDRTGGLALNKHPNSASSGAENPLARLHGLKKGGE